LKNSEGECPKILRPMPSSPHWKRRTCDTGKKRAVAVSVAKKDGK
jgi:hypothetical protein